MKRIMIVPALLALCAQPALADEWVQYEEYYTYEANPGFRDYRAYTAVPSYSEPYYVPFGYVYTDDTPRVYDRRTDCEVEREWDIGGYRETVECEED